MTARQVDEFTYNFPDMHPHERLRELVLYIAERCADDPTFGVTKLNKILYFADVEAYRMLGRPITGAEYQKKNYGPVPKEIVRIRRELADEGAIEIVDEQPYQYTRHRLLARREPNLDYFDEQELAFVNTVVEALWGETAAIVSEASHGLAWKIADDGESIPYEAALLTAVELSPAQLEALRGHVDEHERLRRRSDLPGE